MGCLKKLLSVCCLDGDQDALEALGRFFAVTGDDVGEKLIAPVSGDRLEISQGLEIEDFEGRSGVGVGRFWGRAGGDRGRNGPKLQTGLAQRFDEAFEADGFAEIVVHPGV